MLRLPNIFLILSFLLIATLAHAQSLGQVSSVQFSVYPETPGPHEQVTITAQGVGGFLGDAQIKWEQDGKTVLSGVGESTFSFTTGAIGTRSTIHVDIDSPDYGAFTHEWTISPSGVTLIWEAGTSVPPLYRGKALYSPGSQIKVVALPQIVLSGSFVPSNHLSYRWSVGGEPATASSGLGRTVFTYSGDQLKLSENIQVDVYAGSTKVGHASLTLPATTPGVLLYVQDPLRGLLLDQALPATVSLAGKELTVKAQPLYFAKENLNMLSYTWALNSQPVTSTGAKKGVVTLRQAGSGAGTSLLTLDLQNDDPDKLLQNASAQLSIIFGAQQTTGSTRLGI